ncbi:MAG: glycosyltransferase family 8 protein [Chroococcidiopsidaceae cyanobacterium CP_BM_RX_35]|nr:glycosyltransferase family 8 protein [Chroococcidiopsidaceae cyanobacterium CP_BM_RX_35]
MEIQKFDNSMASNMAIQTVSPTDKNSEAIILVCAADDNYAMPLAVMIRSVIENLGDERRIALFIIDGGIEKHNKSKIERSIRSEKVDLSWLQPLNILIEDLEVLWYYSKAVYFRLFISELLPQSYKKAIYLDSDLIVVEDLGKLWDVDIEDKYISAVQDLYPVKDEYLAAIHTLGFIPTLQESNFSNPLSAFTDDSIQTTSSKSYQSFFNAGVLVINLEKWRSQRIGIEIINFLKTTRQYHLNDQDGLNIFFKDEWKKLDQRWNQTAGIYDNGTWISQLLAEDEFESLVNNPCIIHFTSATKPWNSIDGHPAQPLFYYYLDMTDWSGWRFNQWKRIRCKFIRELKRIWETSSFSN